uniref:Uncharacterized protein n=1 Tax=viral metagenome TaxID=1070528 RepID=A0A6C0LEF7_9ZZZZ
MFKRNYFYELPDDIQITIYKHIFTNCILYFANDRSIKYLNRLYRAVNNPSNTCVYSIAPKGIFEYKRVASLEGGSNFCNTKTIYLDRSHLLTDTSQFQCDTISYYLFPLFTANKTLRTYLAIHFNTFANYDKKMITNMKVCEDRVDIVFANKFTCNADIYYNILVGYNILYNSLSDIIYSVENVLLFSKFLELFKWLENNNRFEGYTIHNRKIIPVFDIKNDL